MKTKFRLLILVIILALGVTTVNAVAEGPETYKPETAYQATEEPTATPEPYDPETVPVNPTLLAKYEEFFPPAVIPVTDGVWVARGYNRDNPTLIEGVNGLIVVDPGESIPAAQIVKDASAASNPRQSPRARASFTASENSRSLVGRASSAWRMIL